MKAIKIKNLEPGQIVGLANCFDTGEVVKRLAKNLYLINYQGHQIEMQRQHLAVNRLGRWTFGPCNAQ